MEREASHALPSWQYGDPADFLDRKRAEDAAAQKRKEQKRLKKARRIKRLVAKAKGEKK